MGWFIDWALSSPSKPEEVDAESGEFMQMMCMVVVGPHCDPRFVINMDQTPVYFSMMPKKTLELVGAKMVHVWSLTNDTKRATVMVTIMANDMVLPLMMIFKGKPYGRITKTEFNTYQQHTFIAVRRMGGWTRGSCQCWWRDS
jgi:hypothetical protein